MRSFGSRLPVKLKPQIHSPWVCSYGFSPAAATLGFPILTPHLTSAPLAGFDHSGHVSEQGGALSGLGLLGRQVLQFFLGSTM